MSISDKVKAVLSLGGKKQVELAEHFGMSKQTMSNKVARDSWSGKDLAKVADFVGGRLAIILPDGQTIFIEPENDEKPERD